MENNGKAKKVVGRSFRLNFILYSCLILACYALFSVNKFFVKDFERGYSATGTGYVLGIVAINFFILLFLLLPYILIKTFPKFYELCQNTRDSSTRRVSVVRGSECFYSQHLYYIYLEYLIGVLSMFHL